MTDGLEVVQKGTLNKMLAMQIRIEKLEAANLKQSCIKVDDQMRIEKLEAALREIIDRAEHRMGHAVSDDVCVIARKALEEKDE